LKPQRVDLSGVTDAAALARRVVQTRLREVRRLAAGLEQRDRQGLHDFRIACKRLRYALERFADIEPALASPAEGLAAMQGALGEAHDRDGLLAILPPNMAQTEHRLRVEREESVDRAGLLWAQAQQLLRDCDFISFE
jgi:CHAD domain-containing protein